MSSEEVESPILEKGKANTPFGPPRRASTSSTISDTSHSLSNESTSTRHDPTDLEKIETARSLRRTPSRTIQRANTALSTIRSRRPVAPFNHPLSHAKTDLDVIVDFEDSDDPYRPLNWTFRKKVITTALYGLTTMGGTFASSVYSSGTTQVAQEFHVGNEVAILGIALLLFGFGLGPLIWGPLSEVYGRKPAVLIPYFVGGIFSFAGGAAKDLQTLMLARFFTGFFCSGAITNTGGVLSDIWAPEQRGAAIVGYAFAVVGGPTLGPVVGAAICESYLRWRWTEYVTGIYMMFILLLDVLILDESYAPVLLVRKARRLRFSTGNWALHAHHEEWDVSIRELGRKYLIVPIKLLTTPICLLVALYASFTYGVLYAELVALSIEFEQVRGWKPVPAALPFLALLVGILFASMLNLANQKYYIKRYKANGNRAVPEARLPPMMFGSVVFSGGLFMFAWTSSPSIHWIAPVIANALIGLGFFTIFQAALNYLIDTFAGNAASAIAANTFLRSVFAGAFPLFMTPLLHNLGVDWGMTVFACFSLLLIPVPFLFFVFGKRIRARGEYSKASVH